MLDMPPQHHQAHGQRRRQQQPDRPPEQCPESGGDHDRDAGEPCALAVEPGLDHLTGDPLATRKRPTTQNSIDHPGSTATARAAGNAAAITGPT